MGGGDGKKLSRFPKGGGCPLAHVHVSVIKVFGLFRLSLLGSFWKGMMVLEIRKLVVSFRVLRVQPQSVLLTVHSLQALRMRVKKVPPLSTPGERSRGRNPASWPATYPCSSSTKFVTPWTPEFDHLAVSECNLVSRSGAPPRSGPLATPPRDGVPHVRSVLLWGLFFLGGS